MQPDITEDLEAMVDKHGLTHVLVGLACVCFEKGEHLRVNWQDKATAKVWDADGKIIENAARSIRSDG